MSLLREITRLDGAANVGASVDSVYTRVTGISGTPLRDGYNFGQTIINDYGRPYWKGFNNITGLSADAEAGPSGLLLFKANTNMHLRYLPILLRCLQRLPQPMSHRHCLMERRTANQFQLLNSAVSLNIDNVQFSFGEQSEWLGPGESGSLLMSDNAAPFPSA